jgi:hypothetical protein
MKLKVLSLLCATVLCSIGCAGHDDTAQIDKSQSPITSVSGNEISALGAFSCDFSLDMTKLVEPLGATIERDRIFLQKEVLENTFPKHPGMIQKHIPVTPTGPTTLLGGGRYLFQGRAQAAVYSNYINNSYTYPGTTQFLDRQEFSNAECRDWGVIKAWNFNSIDTHTALRTERFDTGLSTLAQETVLAVKLFNAAPAIIQEAQARGYAEVHILHSAADHKVQLVYFVSRMSGPDVNMPDVVAFGKVSSDSALGNIFPSSLSLTKVFDLSSFVLTVWLPYASGDHGAASLWPNSPAIPGPVCGDGVCTPSRNENSVNCVIDCIATCGDNICQSNEDLNKCPSDCGHPFL